MSDLEISYLPGCQKTHAACLFINYKWFNEKASTFACNCCLRFVL